jgi:hypothetical protein
VQNPKRCFPLLREPVHERGEVVAAVAVPAREVDHLFGLGDDGAAIGAAGDFGRATAPKLAVLFWCMLTRGEDYAHQQPSLTRKKLRCLEIIAGAPKYKRRGAGTWSTNILMREADLELAQQAETSYKCVVKDQLAGGPARKAGASVALERASISHSTRTSRAADHKLLTSALRYVIDSRPTQNLRRDQPSDKTEENNSPANTGQR